MGFVNRTDLSFIRQASFDLKLLGIRRGDNRFYQQCLYPELKGFCCAQTVRLSREVRLGLRGGRDSHHDEVSLPACQLHLLPYRQKLRS